MKLITYKEREGLIIRFVTWAMATLFTLFGCVSLFYYIPPENITTIPPQKTFWGYTVQQLMGSDALYTIPFFEVNITIGTLISVTLFILVVIIINRFVINGPKPADFLIETEFELKKVSWPPKNEYWGSSIAVIVSVVVIGMFIFIVDRLLTQIMKLIYLQ